MVNGSVCFFVDPYNLPKRGVGLLPYTKIYFYQVVDCQSIDGHYRASTLRNILYVPCVSPPPPQFQYKLFFTIYIFRAHQINVARNICILAAKVPHLFFPGLFFGVGQEQFNRVSDGKHFQ
jgi:hypothetical protein